MNAGKTFQILKYYFINPLSLFQSKETSAKLPLDPISILK